MKLFKIYQDKNSGYDTYSDAVVVAKDAEAARHIHPATYCNYAWRDGVWITERGTTDSPHGSWTEPEHVGVIELGEARDDCPNENGVVCASFHAG